MTREEILEILMLLSNIESVIDMKLFREQCPDWIMEKLESVTTILQRELTKDKK